MYKVVYSIKQGAGYAVKCNNERDIISDLEYYGKKGYVVMFTEDLEQLQNAFNLKSINEAIKSIDDAN